MALAFPWLFVSFALYNAIAFGKGSALPPQDAFNQALVSFTMVSGAVWRVSAGDALIALTLVFLFAEMLKAARSISLSLIDRALSAVLFLVCAVEFTLRKEAATSVFFLITLMTFIEFVSGISFTVKAARRGAA
ncbi:MAG: hypothetical protein HY765_07085 [Rhodomicrobium sp.]|nr:hypothetical protein [Rhodomicrobium sp.]